MQERILAITRVLRRLRYQLETAKASVVCLSEINWVASNKVLEVEKKRC
jgi:hypothetical protein